jgi:hypothetical protein
VAGGWPRFDSEKRLWVAILRRDAHFARFCSSVVSTGASRMSPEIETRKQKLEKGQKKNPHPAVSEKPICGSFYFRISFIEFHGLV